MPFKEEEFHYSAVESREEYIAGVAEAGGTIREPQPNQLFLDIDSTEQYDEAMRRFRMFVHELSHEYEYPPNWEETPSISGDGHWHVVITLPFEVDIWQRIAWQSALNSDPTKELLSCFRILRGDSKPVLFAEYPRDTSV